MRKPGTVKVVQSGEDRVRNGNGVFDCRRPPAVRFHPVVQRSTRNELARNYNAPTVQLSVHDGHDVRMAARPEPQRRLPPDRFDV